MVYKRVTALAGHTSRVAELLEQVKRLSAEDEDATVKTLYLKNVSSSHEPLLALAGEDGEEDAPQRLTGDTIKFDRCGGGLAQVDRSACTCTWCFCIPSCSSPILHSCQPSLPFFLSLPSALP